MNWNDRSRVARRIQLLCLIPVAVVLWGSAKGLVWYKPMREISLLNGSLVRLAGATYGKRHRVPQAYSSDFPTRFQEWISRFSRRSEQVETGSAPKLLLWFAEPKDDDTPQPGPFEIRFVDRHGDEISWSEQELPDELAGVSLADLPSAGGLVYLRIGRFPRREKELHFRFYQTGKNGNPVKIGDVRTPNPAALTELPEPPWTPRPLPLSQTSMGIQLTLEALLAGIDPASSMEHPEPATDLWDSEMRLSLRIQKDGVVNTNWYFIGPRLMDATGNYAHYHLVGGAWSYDTETKRFYCLMDRCFSPTEPVWKLRLALAPRRQTADPSSIWTLNGLPLEGLDPAQHFSKTIHGLQCRVTSVSRREIVIERQLERNSNGEADLPKDNADPDWILASEWNYRLRPLGVTDDQRRPGRCRVIRRHPLSEDRNRTVIRVRGIPASARGLNLTVALEPTPRFEFLVAPRYVKRPPSPLSATDKHPDRPSVP